MARCLLPVDQAVDIRCRLFTDPAATNILAHRLMVALLGVAVATATANFDDKSVAFAAFYVGRAGNTD